MVDRMNGALRLGWERPSDQGARSQTRVTLLSMLVVVTLSCLGCSSGQDDVPNASPGADSTTTTGGSAPSTTSTPDPTTTSTAVVSEPTTVSTTTTTVRAIDYIACTREAVAASLGLSPSDILEGPTCHDGFGWTNYCETPECIHAGHIIKVESGRWVSIAALLQDCAENFTGFGVPADTAVKFFPYCSTQPPAASGAQPSPEVAELIETYDTAYADCRGLPGTPEGDQACDISGDAYQRLYALGWCYGRESDTAAAYWQWHECGPDSNRPE